MFYVVEAAARSRWSRPERRIYSTLSGVVTWVRYLEKADRDFKVYEVDTNALVPVKLGTFVVKHKYGKRSFGTLNEARAYANVISSYKPVIFKANWEEVK